MKPQWLSEKSKESRDIYHRLKKKSQSRIEKEAIQEGFEMGDTKARVLELFETTCEKFTYQQVARKMKISEAEAFEILTELEDEGKIEIAGSH